MANDSKMANDYPTMMITETFAQMRSSFTAQKEHI